MRALVTGATGFIGYHLALMLHSEGFEVHVFTRNHSNRWRIRHMNGLVTEHSVDLGCFSEVEQAVRKIKPDVIGHCAAYGGFSFQNLPDSILRTNVMGTIHLLAACEKTGFQAFIHTGSSSEYGIKHQPMKETDVLEPVSDYAVSKAAATLYCRALAIRKKLPVVILRLFSPFGPWDDPARMIAYVVKSLLRKQRPNMTSPSSVRDYIFIKDVMEAYKQVIKGSFESGGIYNIGAGKQSSVKEVVSAIRKIMGTSIEPLWGEERISLYESPAWVADISKAKSDLLWSPSTSLHDGLVETIEWIEKHIHFYS